MANGTVVLAMAGTGAVVVADDIKQGKGIRGTHLLALGFVFVVMTSVADAAPKLAVPFSLLIFTGVILTKGPDVFSSFNAGGAKVPKYAGSPSKLVPPAVSIGGASPSQVVIPPKQRQRTTGPSGITG